MKIKNFSRESIVDSVKNIPENDKFFIKLIKDQMHRHNALVNMYNRALKEENKEVVRALEGFISINYQWIMQEGGIVHTQWDTAEKIAYNGLLPFIDKDRLNNFLPQNED